LLQSLHLLQATGIERLDTLVLNVLLGGSGRWPGLLFRCAHVLPCLPAAAEWLQGSTQECRGSLRRVGRACTGCTDRDTCAQLLPTLLSSVCFAALESLVA